MRLALCTVSLLSVLATANAYFGHDCVNAFTGLTGEAATCLNVDGLKTVLTSNDTVSAVDAYLKTWCDAPACSNTTLSDTISNIESECKLDFGLLFDVPDKLLEAFQTYYDRFREVLCLKDKDAGEELCVTHTIKAINTTSNGFSIKGLADLAVDIYANKSIDTSIECSVCAQGLYDEFRTDLPGPIRDAVDGTFTKACGTGFVGNTPAEIVPFNSGAATKLDSSMWRVAMAVSLLLSYLALA